MTVTFQFSFEKSSNMDSKQTLALMWESPGQKLGSLQRAGAEGWEPLPLKAKARRCVSWAQLWTHPAFWQVKQFYPTLKQNGCRGKRSIWVSNLKRERVLGLEIKL